MTLASPKIEPVAQSPFSGSNTSYFAISSSFEVISGDAASLPLSQTNTVSIESVPTATVSGSQASGSPHSDPSAKLNPHTVIILSVVFGAMLFIIILSLTIFWIQKSRRTPQNKRRVVSVDPFHSYLDDVEKQHTPLIEGEHPDVLLSAHPHVKAESERHGSPEASAEVIRLRAEVARLHEQQRRAFSQEMPGPPAYQPALP